MEWATKQWADALAVPVPPVDLVNYDRICITGMGGSGITGDVIAMLAAERSPMPVLVHRGYGIPAYVNGRTLVLAISYSGNTEETISAVRPRRGGRASSPSVGRGNF